MSILTQKQEQALLDLELYLANPEVLPTLPATKPPPLPPPPTSAQKPAIFNTGESKKRYGEAVTQDEKESEKRLKVTQAAPVAPVAPVTPVTPVTPAVLAAPVAPVTPVEPVAQVAPNVPEKHSNCIFTIFFSNNKNMIQIPSIKITEEIENKFLYFLRECIFVLNDGKISLNEVFDKAFNKAITFLNVIINMNIKPMVLTIGTNDDIVTDTSCLHITFDFFGSIGTLFLYRSLKMTNIDTFDKQVISDIKDTIAANAGIFAANIQSLVIFTEADAIKAKHDLNTAQENATKARDNLFIAHKNAITAHKNATKAKNDLNMAQGNATKAKNDLNMAQENANTAQKNTTINHKKYEDHIRSRENAIKAKGDLNMAQENATKAKRELNMAQENVITTQENVITAQKNFIMVQEKSVVAQKNVTTAHQKLSTTQADATLIKEKAINAAKDATKKTKDAQDTEMITKDKEKINLPKPERLIIFKS